MIQAVVAGRTVTVQDSERTKVQTWDRVMGYFRPVNDWNIGKKQEHRDRVRFRLPVYTACQRKDATG